MPVELRRTFLRKLVLAPFVGGPLIQSAFGQQDHLGAYLDELMNPRVRATLDGVVATQSTIYGPMGICFDSQDNLYVADSNHFRIRRIEAKTNIITTVAGTGERGTSGNGGPALKATLHYPSSIAVDSDGNIFVAEMAVGQVRKIDGKTGIISTYAGRDVKFWNDRSVEGDIATERSLVAPYGLALDADTNLILSDTTRILKIDRVTRRMTTVAGQLGPVGFSADGTTAAQSTLENATGISVDRDNNIYFAENGSRRIRRIRSVDQKLETLHDMPPSRSAPESPTLDNEGNLYFVEFGRVFQMILSSKTLRPFAGKIQGNTDGEYSGDGGPAIEAGMQNPAGLAFDRDGNLYIADYVANRIRRVVRRTNVIQTIAGTGEPKHLSVKID